MTALDAMTAVMFAGFTSLLMTMSQTVVSVGLHAKYGEVWLPWQR